MHPIKKVPASLRADQLLRALTTDRRHGVLDKAAARHAFEYAAGRPVRRAASTDGHPPGATAPPTGVDTRSPLLAPPLEPATEQRAAVTVGEDESAVKGQSL